MAFFTDIETQIAALRAMFDVDVDDLTAAMSRLTDEQVAQAIARAGALGRAVERIGIVASGVAARRSARVTGHGGLAQTRGHRNAVSLVQDLTGASRTDAARHVRLGESLLELSGPLSVTDDPGPAPDIAETPAREPWHAPLGRALLNGALSAAQHEAILRNLGEPPPVDPARVACVCGTNRRAGDAGEDVRTGAGAGSEAGADAGAGPGAATCTCAAAIDAATVAAWRLAAGQLIDEAAQRTVEELRSAARAVRDCLDPDGAERRHLARFEARAFRLWTDAEGVHRGSFVFDDLGAAWIRSIHDTALRPRRGGPRFVDSAERERATALAEDPRTNDQLAYDLMLDVLRAGTLADAESVLGARQAGVRVVTVVGDGADCDTTAVEATDAARGAAPASGAVPIRDAASASASASDTTLLEETGQVIPGWAATQRVCDSGSLAASVDPGGNPLDLGREARLFSPRQRVALGLRDGGCRWNGCDRPASYCEAHHIDPYAQGGRTDVDRGILLCRFHHMQLHHGGWRITRRGRGDFALHPPPGRGESTRLRPRLALAYTWSGIDPPPRRFRETT